MKVSGDKRAAGARSEDILQSKIVQIWIQFLVWKNPAINQNRLGSVFSLSLEMGTTCLGLQSMLLPTLLMEAAWFFHYYHSSHTCTSSPTLSPHILAVVSRKSRCFFPSTHLQISNWYDRVADTCCVTLRHDRNTKHCHCILCLENYRCTLSSNCWPIVLLSSVEKEKVCASTSVQKTGLQIELQLPK